MANIKLNNKTYPIPDSKLATATGSFITHLGTIAGNGLKVVIGGVEYGVDATKVAGAVAGFEGTLGELEPVVLALAPGLYQPGAIALWQEGDYDTASAMMTSSWDELETNGVIAVSKSEDKEEVELPEMNEYGFYFGVPYSATMDGVSAGFTFNEDGSAVMHQAGENTEIPAGAIVYSDHSIDMTALDMPVLTVSADGTCIDLGGILLYLEVSNLSEINEYGFYYGAPYSVIAEDGTLSLTFNEDGSIVVYMNGETETIPAGAVIYGDHIIDMTAMNFPVFTVHPDGKSIEADGIVLTVSGGGTPEGVLVVLGEISGDLVLPDTAIYIRKEAFKGRDALTGIVIPDSVITLDEKAFYQCSGLETAIIGNGVTSIGENAFTHCSNLTMVILGKNVKTIGDYAFNWCSSLISVFLPESVTTISDSIFTRCNSNLTVYCGASSKPVDWPDNWNSGGYHVIWNVSTIGQTGTRLIWAQILNEIHICSYVGTEKEIIIPSELNGAKVTSIDEDAFYNCDSLTSVVIPDSVTTIGDWAFNDCDSLTSVVIPDSVTTIGERAFDSCGSLTSVVIPDSVTTMGGNAFTGCDNLVSVTIGKGVSNIHGAFTNCKSLTNIVVAEHNNYYKSVDNILYSKDGTVLIKYACGKPETTFIVPDTVHTIEGGALSDNTNLLSITIPSSVTSIGKAAFIRSTSLESLTIPLVWETYFSTLFGCGRFYEDSDKYVPASLKTIVILEGATDISNYEFAYCSNITSITIPNNVTSIGKYAFQNCDSLTSIVIPDSVTNIDSYAFNDCGGLISVVIGDSVTSIGNNAFYQCNKLIEVINKSSLNITAGSSDHGYVARYAKEVHDGESKLVNKDDYLFYGSNNGGANYLVRYLGNEAELVLPENYNGESYEICSMAFESCNSLTSVVIPNSVATIGNYAFNNCSNLTSVVIPDSVTNIGQGAFSGCTNLKYVYISDIAKWYTIEFGTASSNPLYYAKNLYVNNVIVTELVIPDSVTTIGNYAFFGCSSLASVVIPDSVTTIGVAAFQNCSGLTSVTIGDSVTTIGNYAFAYCSGLISVVIPDSVTTIGEHSFYYCSSLTSVTIGDSVIGIGMYAFSGCTSIKDVYYTGSVEEWNAITKGYNWRLNMAATCIQCTDGQVAL